MEEIRVELYGRVQGIGFRNNVRKFALKNGLKGFVVNKDDGIFILAQGEKKELDEFFSWLHKGPGFAKIESFNCTKGNAEKAYPDFRIIRDGSIVFDRFKSLFNLSRNITGFRRDMKVPVHIALIPDGNRRWAKSKGFEGTFGHYKAGSYENLEEIFREGKKLGVKFMSIWAFSTENWKRSEKEQKDIFDLILSGAKKFHQDAHKNKIRFRHIGRKDRLPRELVEVMKKLEKETVQYSDFNVQLCIDYGGRDEIVRAVNKILKDRTKIIDEESLEKFMDTAGLPDPDLIIRTSGEKRTSGFMPYQGSYSELYFSDLYFPDFGAKELNKAIMEFCKRQRRFGGGN